MAKTYIFAIGGTGARVMRSLTMLMAAGVDNLHNTICPIIIDYDKDNGDKLRAIETMRRYSKVYTLVNGAMAKLDRTLTQGKKPFFMTEYKALFPNWSWNFDFQENKDKFEDYIDYDGVSQHSVQTKHLIDTLYDISNDDVYSELKLNMEVGFQGNPNIGSVVFNELKESTQFTDFTNDFGNGDKIVVVGSLFGGTGSSGIPKIVSAIRNNNNPNIATADISVVFVLPYFAVDLGSDQEISIKSAIFNSKTKAALNYYQKSGINLMINNIYYVGDKVPTRVKPNIGSKNQKNDAHVVELIAAMAVAHSIIAEPQNIRDVKYKFNVAKDITDGIGIDEFVGNTTDWTENSFVRGIVHNLINLVYATRYFWDKIVNADDEMKTLSAYTDLGLEDIDKKVESKAENRNYVQDYCAALYKFICKDIDDAIIEDGLWQWLKEIHSKSHKEHRMTIFKIEEKEICDILDGFDFRSNDRPFFNRGNAIRKPLLTYGNFNSEMNNAIAFYSEGMQRIKNRPKESYPWIFNDILHTMSEKIRTNSGKEMTERFKLVP